MERDFGLVRNPTSWSNEKHWIIQETKRKSWKKMLKSVVAETIYGIWWARKE